MAAVSKADAAIVARFLYAWPDPPAYCALSERRNANNDLALDLLRRVRRVVRTPANPLILPLDAEATKAFDSFLATLHRDLGHAEGLEADWMGKGSGTVARLAGILELLAWSGSDSGALPTQVGASAVQAAIELWHDYFRLHAAFVFERGGPDDLLRQARRVVHWLKVNPPRRSEPRGHQMPRALSRGERAARRPRDRSPGCGQRPAPCQAAGTAPTRPAGGALAGQSGAVPLNCAVANVANHRKWPTG